MYTAREAYSNKAQNQAKKKTIHSQNHQKEESTNIKKQSKAVLKINCIHKVQRVASLYNIMLDHGKYTPRRTHKSIPDRFIHALPNMVKCASKDGY